VSPSSDYATHCNAEEAYNRNIGLGSSGTKPSRRKENYAISDYGKMYLVSNNNKGIVKFGVLKLNYIAHTSGERE